MVSSIGKRIPAYSTAIGKALLSGYTNEKIAALYPGGLQKITDKTITDPEVLYTQLKEIRDTKVAYETEESSLNITCIAVPVEKNGEVVAALSVSIPLFRAMEDKKKQIKEVLFEAKGEIEALIKTLPFNI